MEKNQKSNLDLILNSQIPEKGNLSKSDFKKVIKKKAQSWINLFNEVPGIKSDFYEGPDAEKIIDIKILTSLTAFMNDGIKSESFEPELPHAWFALLINGTFVNYISESHGELQEDNIYASWKKELDKSDAKNWADLYRWISDLVKRYTEVIPSLPKIEHS